MKTTAPLSYPLNWRCCSRAPAVTNIKGMCRVRSLPRSSSASSKPSISGIWTSRKASATSCTRSSSSASEPERAVKTITSWRANSAASASTFSSRSSTSKPLIGGSANESIFSAHPHRGWTCVQCLQHSGDFIQCQHAVRRPQLERRQRHMRRQRGIGPLDHGNTTGNVNCRKPGCPIFVGTGENDAQEPIPIDVGSRLKQHVDGWPRMMHWVIGGERQLRARIHQQMIVIGREVNRSRRHHFLVFSLPNGYGAFSREYVDEYAGPVPRQVKYDENRRPQSRRERG